MYLHLYTPTTSLHCVHHLRCTVYMQVQGRSGCLLFTAPHRYFARTPLHRRCSVYVHLAALHLDNAHTHCTCGAKVYVQRSKCISEMHYHQQTVWNSAMHFQMGVIRCDAHSTLWRKEVKNSELEMSCLCIEGEVKLCIVDAKECHGAIGCTCKAKMEKKKTP